MTAKIRPATREDARAIAQVHVASWRWAYRDLLPQHVLAELSVDARGAMWRSLLVVPDDGTVVLVSIEDGAIVGFASAGPSRDADASRDTAEVFTLYLLEHATGRGIGRALFTSLVDAVRAAGFARARLWVLRGNHRTRRFYEAAGWRPDGIEDRYEVGGVAFPEIRYGIEF
jgi:L-amino acid N-acyltransferase YncA